MKRFVIISLALIYSLFPGASSAQLLMEHSRVRLTLEPGVTVVDTIALHNRSNEAMPLTIYWEDFEYIEPFDGKKIFMPPSTSAYSLADWISFSPREVTIPPGGNIDVNYTIKAPSNASGGYYGVLFFESGSRRSAESTGVNIITRVGSLFFVEMSDKDKTSLIQDIQLNKNSLEGVIENKGNIVLFPRGIYYVMDEEGLVAERDELERIYLPPVNEADFSLALSDSLPSGQHTLVLTFDLGEGYNIVKEIDFTKDTNGSLKILGIRD